MSNYFTGTIKVIEPLKIMNVGEQQWINVEVSNFSEKPWIATDSDQIRLSYHWMKISGEVIVWDGLRSPLPEEGICPAQPVKTKMLIEAPSMSGSYILNLTLVFENITWFEKEGFETAKLHIQIPDRNLSNFNLLFIGNCQAVEIARILNIISSGKITATSILTTEETVNNIKSKKLNLAPLLSENDLILLHSEHFLNDFIMENFPKFRFKIRIIPRITFSAFHPDICHVYTSKQNVVKGFLGDYQSALIFFGWLNNFSISETLNLFAADVFENLGYFDYFTSSKEFLIEESKIAGLPLNTLIEQWSKQGCWMHTHNHPKLFVLADLTREILAREGIIIPPINVSQIHDNLGDGSVWPVYPEIGEKLGINGDYQFKGCSFKSLEEFIAISFKIFSEFSKEELFSPTISSPRFKELNDFLKKRYLVNDAKTTNPSTEISLNKTTNPYHGLPDYQFWRRAIEHVTMKEVDPVVGTAIKLYSNTKIVTAGSCFAQHISRTLAKSGFNFYVSEREEELQLDEQQRRNFGVFSARFGNIYTSRQLLQLFERAYGTFIPTESYWIRSDNRFVDPFRPQIEPDGFASIIELEKSKEKHLAAVRQMFENLDVFIFTLGLTESWRNKLDGAVYPLAPGVVAGAIDPNIYEFINFSVSDVVTDMNIFIEKLLKLNPKAKMILTVSPVPLIATYENLHVLVATTYSKSVLRASVTEICQQYPICEYFPSYEIITGNYTYGQYFEKDLRSIKPEGVNRVMNLFLSHYSAEKVESALEVELRQQNILLSRIICDEEAIDVNN